MLETWKPAWASPPRPPPTPLRVPGSLADSRRHSGLGGLMKPPPRPARAFAPLAVALCLAGPSSLPAAPLGVAPERFDLAGMHEGLQLVVTAEGKDGRPRDCTREARYTATPAGVVRV